MNIFIEKKRDICFFQYYAYSKFMVNIGSQSKKQAENIVSLLLVISVQCYRISKVPQEFSQRHILLSSVCVENIQLVFFNEIVSTSFHWQHFLCTFVCVEILS